MKMYKLIFLCLFIIINTFYVISCGTQKTTSTISKQELPAYLYYKKSLSAVENQNYQKALSLLDTAIALKPEVSQFYYAKGQIYELKGERQSAIGAYENALEYKSHFPDCWKKLAILYIEFKQPDKATQLLRYLTNDQPDSIQYEVLLADAYLADNKLLLARERLNYFEKNGGKSIETLRIRGLIQYRQGNYSEAIKYLDQFVTEKPQNFEAQKYLGIACIKSNLPEKGISHLNRALSINPEDAELYVFRAEYFLLMKKVDTATEQLDLALKIDDKNSMVLLEISKFCLTQGDTIRAETLLKKAIVENINCWECYKYMGIIAYGQNRPEEAYIYLQKYVSNIFFRDIEAEQLLEKLNYLRKN